MSLTKRNPNNTRRGEMSYKLTRSFRDGSYHQICTIECAKCDRVEEFKHAGDYTPELIRKRMLGKGWSFDPFAKKNCLCPRCRYEKRDMHTTTSIITQYSAPMEGDNEMAVTSVPTPAPAASNTNKGTTPTPVAAVPRGLNSDERGRVRHLLDKYFDDKVGGYIENYTDQRIGRECDVPWATVREIRETAYGPIREDARLTAIKVEIDRLEKQVLDEQARSATAIAALEKTTSEKIAGFQRIVGDLRAKLEDYQKANAA